jgi:YidC/Oxa1 family membrane protein insertase
MLFWSSFLDLLRVLLLALAHVAGGSLGSGIVLLSVIVRLALLPLTLHLALRAREYQLVLQRLRPELDALRRRHKANPALLVQETQRLYAANGIGMAPKGSLVGALVQMPIGAGVYQTVASIATRATKLFWITNLGKPDALVASIAAGLAGAAVMAGPSSPSSRVTAALAAAVTFVISWRLSAGVGLYWVASSVVGVVQSLLVRRLTSARVLPNEVA